MTVIGSGIILFIILEKVETIKRFLSVTIKSSSMSMSSEIYEFDGCIFNDPFSPFNDSSTIDILQAFQEHNYSYTPLLPSSPPSPPLTTQENLDTPFEEIDQIAPTIFSSSPPSHQLQNLSLYQMGISVTSSNEALDSCHLDVKTEESQLPLYDNYYYGGSDHALKMMQRSYSSNSFQQQKPNGVLYEPKINGLIESQHLQAQTLTSPDQNFSYSHMRRVCSTGDLQVSPLFINLLRHPSPILRCSLKTTL